MTRYRWLGNLGHFPASPFATPQAAPQGAAASIAFTGPSYKGEVENAVDAAL
jgi:hypothetical protein